MVFEIQGDATFKEVAGDGPGLVQRRGEVARARDWHGAAHLKRAWVKEAVPPCPADPPVGRTFAKERWSIAPSPNL
jgi:hypothetical protein